MLPLSGLPPTLAPSAKVWQAAGVIARAGDVAAAAGWRRVLIVTDPGLARLPLLARLRSSMHASGIETDLFASVTADPPISTVDAAIAEAGTPEAVVSLGGGSSIDTAKAVAACLAEGRGATSLIEAPPTRALPHLAVPTTAGTGAEASNSAILTDETGRKRAIIAECLPPSFVLLDPDVLVGQPRGLVVACGLDALSHGLESLVSKQASAASRMFSRECIRLVTQALPRALATPDDAEARSAVQLGAHLGGAALRLARLGYIHALAHAVGEFRHLPHGLLIARMLPAVVAFNTPVAGALYDEAARMAGHAEMPALISGLMRECGVTAGYADLALTAEERAAIVARCVAGPFHTWNPRQAEAADFARLLDAT